MELNKKQLEGLKTIVARYKAKERYTVVSGYAGVGKSTLVQFAINELQLDPEFDVAYIAFTGKAANVLSHKGCPNATTAHKLLYYSEKKKDGTFRFSPRKQLEGCFKLIVVDEVSMLPKKIWDLLLSHRIHVLACGDPFQLPPINKSDDNGVLEHPHVFLDEIMRQAKESGIIRLSMDIRAGKGINKAKHNSSETNIFSSSECIPSMYTWADQILVATNRKRAEINEYMRAAAGRGFLPEIGDKVICLQNKWDIFSNAGTALVNGTIGYINSIEDSKINYNPVLAKVVDTYSLGFDVMDEEGEAFSEINADPKTIITGEKSLLPEEEYIIAKENKKRKQFFNPFDEDSSELLEYPIEFNYGYAITVHRAQGSQWDKVLVVEERFPFDRTEHARWLYTAVTRAVSKCTLILK